MVPYFCHVVVHIASDETISASNENEAWEINVLGICCYLSFSALLSAPLKLSLLDLLTLGSHFPYL